MAKLSINDEDTHIAIDGAMVHEHTNVLSKTMLGVNRAPIGLMPPAIRWISGDGQSYLVERPPAFMTITYTDAAARLAKALPKTSYTIPLPWTTYLVCFSAIESDMLAGMSVFARNEPLRTLDDELCWLPMPNADPGRFNGFCVGTDFHVDFKPQMVQARNTGRWDGAFAVASCINLFWSSHFNADMGTIPVSVIPKSLHDHDGLWSSPEHTSLLTVPWLERWSSLSSVDALNMDWRQAGPLSKFLPPERPQRSLAGYLNQLMKSGKV